MLAQRVVTYQNPNPAPFKVKIAALDQLVSDLETHLLDPKQSVQIGEYFLSNEDVCTKYIKHLMSEDYPSITEEAVPFFMSVSQPVYDHVQNLRGQVDRVEYLGHRQRFGDSEAMKVIISFINLHTCDGSVETLRISLVEYEDTYLIMNFDS